MSFVTQEYLEINPERILFHKLLYKLKCSYLICLLGNSFFCSIKVTDFSSQLYLILTKLTRSKCM